jgi:beta-galactosidase
VWLNGAFVGACKDSRLPSEWEVTGLLQPTSNLLAVQVRDLHGGSSKTSNYSSILPA